MKPGVRKIQKVGNSAGVLLPGEWLRRQGLRPGSKVRIDVSESRVVIFPDRPDREIPVDAKLAAGVGRFLRRHRKTLERLSE